jgi:hypothetical protein
MAAPLGNAPSTAFQNAPLPAIDADDSSEEEEEQMTVDECIQDWYYTTKSRATQFAYANYVKHFLLHG